MPELTDRELVEKSKTGDQGAFTALYERYERRIFNYVARYLGSTIVAQEITQDVFFSFYRSLERCLPKDSVQPWIYRIAVNKVRDHFRRKRAAPSEVSLEADDGSSEGTIADILKTSELDPREALRTKEYHEYIQNVLDALPEKYRQVLILHDIESVPYEDITRILGIPYSRAAQRLSTARLMFRKRVDPKNIGIQFFIFAQIREAIFRAQEFFGRLTVREVTISLLADGKLPRAEAEQVRQWIAGEAYLREKLRLIEEARVILYGVPPLYPSAAMRARVFDLIAEAPDFERPPFLPALQLWDAARERVSITPRPLLGLALCAILIFSGLPVVIQQELAASPKVVQLVGRPLQQGRTIYPGERIRLGRWIETRKGEELDIYRPKQLNLKLKEETALTVDGLSHFFGLIGTNRIEFHYGTLYVKTQERLRRGDLAISTPWFMATHAGTIASFELNPDLLRVAVLNGKFVMKAKGDLREEYPRAITVSEGEEFIYDRRTKKVTHRAISGDILSGLAQFGKSEEVVLLGLPPDGRAAALVGKDQWFAFTFYNITSPAMKQKLSEVQKIFESRTVGAGELKRAEALLEQAEKEYSAAGRRDIGAKLGLVAAAISDHVGDSAKSIEKLKSVSADPKMDPELRTLALCALGIVYEDRLHDKPEAKRSYQSVLAVKPDTFVSEEAKNRLSKLK